MSFNLLISFPLIWSQACNLNLSNVSVTTFFTIVKVVSCDLSNIIFYMDISLISVYYMHQL